MPSAARKTTTRGIMHESKEERTETRAINEPPEATHAQRPSPEREGTSPCYQTGFCIQMWPVVPKSVYCGIGCLPVSL